MTVARIASRAVFAFSSALLVIALCDLWQWFWHAHIRTWHLSLQGLVLLTLMVSLGVVTWKAMRAAREFAETNGQNGLVVYSGYGHLAAACVPTAMVLFVSDEGWLLCYNAVLTMALIVCGWQAARYNRGLQVVRSLLVQIVFPFLFVFLGMFAAVHASSEENRQEEEVQGFKDRGDMAGLRAFLTQKEEVARKAARYGLDDYASVTGVFGFVMPRFLNDGLGRMLPAREVVDGVSLMASGGMLILAMLAYITVCMLCNG